MADTTAGIGDFLGLGCGRNVDLTPSGALRWARTIQLSSAAFLNYYLTASPASFFADDCVPGISLILSDPKNDGTTEVRSGDVSPYGNYAGFKRPQCHTDGMEFPNQSLDSVRNAEMNQLAMY